MKKIKKVSYSGKIAKRNKRRKILKLLVFLALLVLVCVGLVFAMRTDFLQVKEVVVEGAESVSAEELREVATSHLTGVYVWFLPKSNVLLVPAGKIENEILKKFGRVASVRASRSLSGKVKVVVKEKRFVAVWCSSGQECLLVDETGLLYARASKEEVARALILYENVTGEPLQNKFTSPEQMAMFLELVQILRSGGVETKNIIYELADRAVLNTSLTQIIISPSEVNVAEASENILLLIETERKKNPDVEFEYIDARFGNKMFYKTF